MAMARRQHRPPAGHWLTCGPEGPHALVPGGRTCTQALCASASAATAEVSTRMREGGRGREREGGREGVRGWVRVLEGMGGTSFNERRSRF